MKKYAFPFLVTLSGLLAVYLFWTVLTVFFPETFAPQKERNIETPWPWIAFNTWSTDLPKKDTTDEPKEQKDACTKEYDPVCWDDDNAYSNACIAKSKNITIRYKWKCKTSVVSGEFSESVWSDLDRDKTEVGSLSLYDTGSYHHYKNAALKYSFAIPKFAWYQGHGVRDGASHTMAISLSASGVTDFSAAEVKVYLFKKTPANPPKWESVSVSGWIVYIDGDSSQPKVKKIIDTVKESVE